MGRWLRVLGRLEGTSFLLLLFIAMPLKYWAQIPHGVKILGPVHGFLFVAYCLWALWCALEQDWGIKKHILAYVSAVLPFGTFWFEYRYLNQKALIKTP